MSSAQLFEQQTRAVSSSAFVPSTNRKGKVMTQDLILKRIGAHLPSAVASSLRRTCQVWNSAFIPNIRHCHSPPMKVTNYLGAGEHPSIVRTFGHKLPPYNRLLRRSRGLFPCSKYRLTLASRSREGKKEAGALQEFVALCGGLTNELDISGDKGNVDVTSVRKLVFIQFPGLTALNLTLTDEEHSDSDRDGHEDHDSETDESQWQKPLKLTTLTLAYYSGILCMPFGRNGRRLVPKETTTTKNCSLLVDIIKRAVKLKTLILKQGLEMILPLFRDFCPVLSQVTTLKLVTSGAQPPVCVMELLNKLSRNCPVSCLRLNTFVVTIGNCRQIEDPIGPAFAAALLQFLTTQSDSLRALELRTGFSFTDYKNLSELPTQIELPRLQLLKVFRVVNAFSDGQHFFRFDGGAGPTTMNDSFPALESFAYVNADVDWNNCIGLANLDNLIDVSVGGVVTHASLTHLELCCQLSTPALELELLSRFMTAFPSVCKLHLAISAKTLGQCLPQIWTHWPQLEALTVKCRPAAAADDDDDDDDDDEEAAAESLDEALSGVPVRFSQTAAEEMIKAVIQTTHTTQVEFEELVAGLLKRFKIGPGLADMTRLKKCILDLSQCDRPFLTMGDVAGYYGLVAMSSLHNNQLQQFEIRRSAEAVSCLSDDHVSVSMECREMIRARVWSHAVLNFGNDGGLDWASVKAQETQSNHILLSQLVDRAVEQLYADGHYE